MWHTFPNKNDGNILCITSKNKAIPNFPSDLKTSVFTFCLAELSLAQQKFAQCLGEFKFEYIGDAKTDDEKCIGEFFFLFFFFSPFCTYSFTCIHLLISCFDQCLHKTVDIVSSYIFSRHENSHRS